MVNVISVGSKTFFLLLILLFNIMLHAQVRPAHIFASNMVLQRDKPVKIWGMADRREAVKVEFQGQVKTAVANQKGEWFSYLNPMRANTKPANMKISGKSSSVVFSNV